VPSIWSSAAWPVEPPLFAVVVAGTLYWLGGRRRVAARRGLERPAKTAAFYLGLFTIVLALDSPLDPLSDTLFAAHMAQHVLLLTVAPTLVVLSAPWMQMWQPLPLGFRRAVARAVVRHPNARPLRAAAHALGRPLVAWLVFDANLLLWHLPALYDLTLRSQAAHDLEHALFFSTGLLFWAQVFDSAPFRASLDWLWRAAYATTGMLVGWVARGRARLRSHAALPRLRRAAVEARRRVRTRRSADRRGRDVGSGLHRLHRCDPDLLLPLARSRAGEPARGRGQPMTPDCQ